MNQQERNDLVNYRINRAKKTFNEVKILIDNKLWGVAVNRLYYACYYAVIALLSKNKINAETHGGVRRMFGLHFVRTGLITKETGKFYTEIFEKRHSSDYDDFIDISENDVFSYIEPANKLIQEIDRLIKN